MSETAKRRFGFAVTMAVILGAIAILNIGTAPAAPARCTNDGGGGTPSTSPSESPSESPSASSTSRVAPAQTTDSPSPSGSTSSGGGGITLPDFTTLLPGESESTSASPTGGGGGGTVHCESEVTIGYTSPNPRQNPKPTFHGKVRSSEDSCIGGRFVTLFKVKPGRDSRAGHDLTSPRGAWKVQVVRARGRYYAAVKQDTVPTDEGRADCQADKSRRLKV